LLYTHHPEKKNQQKILKLNDIINLMDLTEVYSLFHPTTAQYIFFSAAHGTFSQIDHILGYKASPQVLMTVRKLK
jgi:hypothetical protein